MTAGRGALLAALALALASALFAPSPGAAQRPVDVRVPEEGVVQELVLVDGSRLVGRVEEAGDPVVFRTVSGDVLTVARARIRSLSVAPGRVRAGEYMSPDPNTTRLLFAPTARTLEPGSGYLGVYEILFPFLSIPLGEHVLLSGGTFLLFNDDGGFRPAWIAPKVRVYHRGATDAAVGALVLTNLGSDDDLETLGILYGVVTRGDPDRAVTVGLGYGFQDGDLADNPAAVLGGELRTGRHAKLVTENYLFPGGNGLLSAGPRFFGERLSADLGLALTLGDDDSVVFPLINFVWSW